MRKQGRMTLNVVETESQKEIKCWFDSNGNVDADYRNEDERKCRERCTMM